MNIAAPATSGSRDFVVSNDVQRSAKEPWLRDGQQYRQSLRDGRHVILGRRDIADVTTEPSLATAVDTLATYFDAQMAPETQDFLTTVDPATANRFSTAWLVPRSADDLKRYDVMIRHSTTLTFGVFGRPPDYGPVKAVSFVAWNHLIREKDPEALGKIERFLQAGRENHLVSADVIIDVQANRKLPMPDRAGRLRVVEERKDGVVLCGAKAGNSVLA